MATDRLLLIIIVFAVAAMIPVILGQAFSQFDSMLKTVLYSPKDEPRSEPVRLQLIRAVVAAAIAAFMLLLAWVKG